MYIYPNSYPPFLSLFPYSPFPPLDIPIHIHNPYPYSPSQLTIFITIFKFKFKLSHEITWDEIVVLYYLSPFPVFYC